MFEMFEQDGQFGYRQARPVLDKSDYIDESSLPNKKLPTMLTIKEAAKQVPGFTEYQIRRLCKSGELPCVFAGRKMLINRDNLYKYLYGEPQVDAVTGEQMAFDNVIIQEVFP